MPSRSATTFAGGGVSRRPRPRGRSGRVRRPSISWRAASRSSTSAPNGAVAATASRIVARRRAAAAGARERLAARLGRRPVEDQHAVEVVELVLDDARGEPVELERERGRRARPAPRA